ncbi:MAG: putative baseplate assembly protein [Anaerolineales bacterium]|nr:putative baseplate assembly protein [Anaerolineales bacterium]
MAIPEPILDDLRFQRDLVDEARRRIIRYCPEWTDYNLSDPGITLIELFAWMTELITYRLNQVPEKNYLRFLDLLGLRLQPASSARTNVTFYLSTRFPLNREDDTSVVVPAGFEVATRRTEEDPELIFTTDDRLHIRSPRLTDVRRDVEFNKNALARLESEGAGDEFQPFHPNPRPNDTFYLGFHPDHDLRGHILQLHFNCVKTEAVGVQRKDPPLVWECSVGDGRWEELTPSRRPGEDDTTGGLNNERGRLTFYLPLGLRAAQVQGRLAQWVRCRVEQRRPEQGMYTESPQILKLAAYTIGATTPATHAVIVRGERLGASSGEAGQTFRLLNAPVLGLAAGEHVEVEEVRDGQTVAVPWAAVDDFAHSDRFDRHFRLDTASGEVSFGPSIRQADGQVRQYGRVPEAGRAIVFTRYRSGGGAVGNVPAGKLQVLKAALPYVDRVVNFDQAEGGRDAESLAEAKQRARREVRSQQRAVTAEDFENLARGASRAVARAKCRTPSGPDDRAVPPGVMEVLVVPAAFDSLRAGDLRKLYLEPELARLVQTHLDQYRLLSTTLRLREPDYVGVRVEAEIAVAEYFAPEAVSAQVAERLRQFLSPLALTDEAEAAEAGLGPNWEGWPFGRTLFVSEVYMLIQRVPGVKHVLDVRLAQRPVNPLTEKAAGEGEAPALLRLDGRRLDLPAHALLCSLEHSVKVVEL